MTLNNSEGFTLIELMITVAIIGIIGAVAYPSYLDNVRTAKRSDARITLTEMAATQERIFTENNSYSDAVADLGGSASNDGYYSISVANVGCSQTVNSKTLYSCFALTATAIGDQLQDTDCKSFTLNYLGIESAKDSGNGAAECW